MPPWRLVRFHELVGSEAGVTKAAPAVLIPGMPSGDESSSVSDTEADEMEEHPRGLGYLGWPVCHGRGRSAAVEMEAAVCTPIAVVAAMSLGTLFYKEQLDYLEQSHGSIRIESRMARISATSFRGEFGDQFASIIRRVPSMSRIQNCSVRPGSLL